MSNSSTDTSLNPSPSGLPGSPDTTVNGSESSLNPPILDQSTDDSPELSTVGDTGSESHSDSTVDQTLKRGAPDSVDQGSAPKKSKGNSVVSTKIMKRKIKQMAPYLKLSKKNKCVIRYCESKSNSDEELAQLRSLYDTAKETEHRLQMAECVSFYMNKHQFNPCKRDVATVQRALKNPLGTNPVSIQTVYDKWALPMEERHGMYANHLKKNKPERKTVADPKPTPKTKRFVGYNLFIKDQWANNAEELKAMVNSNSAKFVMNHLSQKWKSDPASQTKFKELAKKFTDDYKDSQGAGVSSVVTPSDASETAVVE